MEEVLRMLLFIAVAIFIVVIVGAVILYNLFSIVVPFIVAGFVLVSIVMGLITAIKNTYIVYKHVYFGKRGKGGKNVK